MTTNLIDDTRINPNDWADFWRYKIGVDPIPANTKNKITNVEWSKYQIDSVSEELHVEWKIKGAFNNGMAIIAGKIHRGPYQGKYLVCIDIDNASGIKEFLSHFGQVDNIDKLAQRTIIEGHADDPNKIHIYFVAQQPLSKRSGIVGSNSTSEIPAIEVKSEGSHGIMFCTPSLHKNGYPYRIFGTAKPTVINKENSEILENCIRQIYQKFGSSMRNNDGLTPIEDLFKERFKVKEGNNRHEALLRVMESLIQRLRTIYSEDRIKDLAWQYNLEHLEPSLEKKEFEKQWKGAKNFVAKNKKSDSNDPEVNRDESYFLNKIKERYISIFYDQLNKLHIMIKINDHIECIPIESKRFKLLLRKEFFEINNTSIPDEKLERLISLIVAQKLFDENTEHTELQLRVANKDDVFYYDLTNPFWEIIKITSEGWEIIKNNETPMFKRYERNSIPQIYPLEDKDNEKYFREFLTLFNLRNEKDFLLFSVYLVSAFIPDIQKPILIISGNGGGAKTTTFTLLKNIIDPSSIDLLSFSPYKEDLIQSLEHHYVNYFDNVSYISAPVSDILCRAVTGSGNSKRELYTTDEDFIYKYKRTIGINGINIVTTRQDLLDRSLTLKVDRIPENKRRKEQEIKEQFERMRPYVLGYIFDVLVKFQKYLKEHPKEKLLKELPRMADFAEYGEIVSRCLGYKDYEFINAYRENIDLQNEELIELHPVAEAVILLMEEKSSWMKTPSLLNKELADIICQVDTAILKSKYWPKATNQLTRQLNELAPILLKKNIEVTTGIKDSFGKRCIRLTKIKGKGQDSNNTSLPSDQTSINYDIKTYIHRIGNSDNFECEHCNLIDDIHFMKKHICKKFDNPSNNTGKNTVQTFLPN
ncbi:hypothetical protein NMY3_00555 [Candidatus Nitrosocosmicus oleophilus]|uniref:DNA primase/polymerase bifunctional N-terminal domain-containing protein n=1 Tax=Candidatus Nitrosocosmicus oleophilus TaxID=1353260 RepID=A0A654LUW7_9ARCH|nr:hypothetical protein [Candidatus Nitrosocosmicus oleophilus]ALI34767.1 hypothetical protein NMY3_00555 [Candidatus Nitrosocosmicus oleophilus]